MVALLSTVLGGLLVGAGTSLFILRGEQITGISGILYGAVTARPGSWLWRMVYVAGMLSAAFVTQRLFPGLVTTAAPAGSLLTVACAGYLVGLGTVTGNGCTSGHGLCGLSRLSKRSLVATATFFSAGIASANIFDVRNSAPLPVLSATAAVVALFFAMRTQLSRESRSAARPSSMRPASQASAPPAAADSFAKQASDLGQLGITLASAALFGTGLLVGGMADPRIVKGFLVLNESWNPSMGLFFATALASSFVGFRAAARRNVDCALAPTGEAARVTPSLVLGAAMFGMGWGLQGVCPGPAIVGLATPSLPSLVFWGGLLSGMYTFYAAERFLPLLPTAPISSAATAAGKK